MELAYFDEQVDRTEKSESYSTKWLALNRRYPEFDHTDVLPMWIADMDFRCPQQVINAVKERAEHGIYGYTDYTIVKKFLKAAANWAGQRYGWKIDAECGVFTPGILLAVTAAVQEFTEQGDGVIIQPPVYYPFKDIILNNQREVKENQLFCDESGYYHIDFDGLECLAKDPNTKMLIFCNPHNPVGRVWKREELERICKICKENRILIVSDEIHADFVMGSAQHVPIASLDQCIANHSITCYAPSKTFNLAGLGVSASFIPNENIRKRLICRIISNRLPSSNVFGPLAGYVAYTQCEEYADKLLEYIQKNIEYVLSKVESIPDITICRPEGTYFAWIDMRRLNMTTDELYHFLYENAKLATDFGEWFGKGGEGFARLNLACPMSVVKQAMEQLGLARKSLADMV